VIGVFDSGSGGLSVLRALVERFPQQAFVYLGDHANAPYGNRPSREIVSLPMFPELRADQIEYVAARVKEFTRGVRV